MVGSKVNTLICGLIWLCIIPASVLANDAKDAESLRALRSPGDVPAVMAVWGLLEKDFTSGDFERHIDMMAKHSGVNVLATTIRAPGRLVTKQNVHVRIKEIAQYAGKYGIKIAMDLDVRLAREAFAEKYPDELQEMLRLREVALKGSGESTIAIPYDILGDHYTYESNYNLPKAGKLARVYVYERTDKGITPETVQDITASCRATPADKSGITVTIPCDGRTAGKAACVMATFAYLAADVFGPHLLPYQREIMESYRDVPLAGACKDEWGFPPCFDGNPAHNDYWYSSFLAKAYAEQTGGRDFLRDCLLMTYGEVGREAERLASINQFNEMCRQRNAACENDFYDAVKSIWGRDAVVATHPTWWPFPDRREMKKNGLDWWIVKRDWAQTDENAPYCVRTALAKKLNSPVWINMYYSPSVPDYQAEMWAGALTGGRIDYHALWPVDLAKVPPKERYGALLRGGLMRGDCRVRLLNFITRSQFDCPVAVVFGQPCAMNWAGPAFDDVGLQLTDALWQAGYPADLIPTNEIWNGALKVGEDGHIQYGPQRYRSVVLYHPEFDKAVTADLFRKAAKGKTALYRIGDWTRDFVGKSFDGAAALPSEMVVLKNANAAVAEIARHLAESGVVPQPKADRHIEEFGCRTVSPPVRGESRLLDGTHVVVAGGKDAAGDPIQQTIRIGAHTVTVDAIGVVGVRLDRHGQVEAFAAGGLRRLDAGDLKIELPERLDVALFRNDQGRFRGVLQDCPGPVPAPLAKLTEDWLRLSVPVPLE